MMPENIGLGKFTRVKEEMQLLKKQRNLERKRKIEDKKAIISAINQKEQLKKLSKAERLRLRLPPSVLLRIV